MAFDDKTRRTLFKTVTACRNLLTEDFDEQLRGRFGIYADEGRVLEIDRLTSLNDTERETARLLRERIDHLAAGKGKQGITDAVQRIRREQAFTVLNRFAALRMAEERGVIRPSVGGGFNSIGFQIFERAAGGEQSAAAAFGSQYDRYLVYLDCLFDELSLDLGVLFDRTDAMGLLFPSENALRDLFAELNSPGVAHLWAEDETIGWIYQYYNTEAERKAARYDENGKPKAPQNSRELAIRNQFFTPRYVVEFLTDNTLGRIWYEMCQGQTRLKDQCRYLVLTHVEIFLADGESAPEVPSHQSLAVGEESLSQEELLRQPVHILHRPLKDPREIRLLDPACGSMHFGLYAFDLFEVIYEEAWDKGFCPILNDTYSSKDEFLKDVPRLIIEHNIHGVDIDPRAAQIAGLSLWLRAQKAWENQRVKPAERPQIRRSNIVCAEPMPGSLEMLEEFSATLDPPLLGDLVKTVFGKMLLAGEAGSLLKIEEEIRTAIDSAKKLWSESGELLPGLEAPGSPAVLHPLSSDFWETVENRLLDSLHAYAEQADADSYQRRLFADDAARGFAFIDLCRKRYDAVVMNPPFGQSSDGAKDYIFRTHEREKIELGACFITRMLSVLTDSGTLGIIANRTMLFAPSFQPWRESCLKGITVCLDLGFGVLDALVENSCFTVSKIQTTQSVFVPLLDSVDKGLDALAILNKYTDGETARSFIRANNQMCRLGAPWFYYWLPATFVTALGKFEAKSTNGLISRSGLQTCDNFRFLRLVWELIPTVSTNASWPRLTKGGDYQPFWADVFIRINWTNDGQEIKEFIEQKYSQWSKQIPSVELYKMPGATYTERTTSSLSLRVLPAGCLFDKKGPFIGIPETSSFRKPLLAFVGLSYIPAVRALIESLIGLRDATSSGSAARDYLPSMIEKLPLPDSGNSKLSQLADAALACIREHQRIEQFDESTSFFCGGFSSPTAPESMSILANEQERFIRDRISVVCSEFSKIMTIGRTLFGISEEDESRLESFFGVNPFSYEGFEPVGTRLRDFVEAASAPEDRLVDMVADRVGATSAILKKSYVANRRLELLALHYGTSPSNILTWLDSEQLSLFTSKQTVAEALVSLFIGLIFGRWDIRYATGERRSPDLPDPFDPLPVCPPGMLQNSNDLPAEPKDVPADYPLSISWPGILVDDANHSEDIVARVREAIEVIWKDRAETIEDEACEILDVKAKRKENLDALRVYFRDPNRFFKDHLACYSKSRRKAPIYWPLSTDSGSYTLWIYYHRLTRQTLFNCIEMIELKREELGREIESLRSRIGTGGTAEESQKIEDQSVFLAELKTLRDRLLEVTNLPYHPDLNDGVQITAAPLWQCFRHGPWQKVLKDTWIELAKKEEYDWAHLAMSIWPERVVPKCAKDRSLAIAHGIDDLLWVPDLSIKKKDQQRPLKSPDEELKLLKQAGHSKEDLAKAAEDVTAAEKSGLLTHLWIEQPPGTWRRRKSPKEEIENEIARRKGR